MCKGLLLRWKLQKHANVKSLQETVLKKMCRKEAQPKLFNKNEKEHVYVHFLTTLLILQVHVGNRQSITYPTKKTKKQTHKQTNGTQRKIKVQETEGKIKEQETTRFNCRGMPLRNRNVSLTAELRMHSNGMHQHCFDFFKSFRLIASIWWMRLCVTDTTYEKWKKY